ncbi:MAG: hypothetical protein ACRDO7_09990 [Nocardioidaceae bacterium]
MSVPLLTAGASDASPSHEEPHHVTWATTTDRDDTRGPLDVSTVTHRLTVYGKRHVHIAYTLRTFEPFSTRDLTRRHRNFTIELGTEPEPGASHNISIYARDGKLRAKLISNATRKPVARLDVRRVGRTGLRVRGPRRLIGARRYFVLSRYEKRSTAPCGRVGNIPITCGDDIPDRGWLRMDRPAWPRQ